MLVNDYLRFALKILFTGGLHTGAPFDLQVFSRYFSTCSKQAILDLSDNQMSDRFCEWLFGMPPHRIDRYW